MDGGSEFRLNGCGDRVALHRRAIDSSKNGVIRCELGLLGCEGGS
jgi:hypothetical protein